LTPDSFELGGPVTREPYTDADGGALYISSETVTVTGLGDTLWAPLKLTSPIYPNATFDELVRYGSAMIRSRFSGHWTPVARQTVEVQNGAEVSLRVEVPDQWAEVRQFTLRIGTGSDTFVVSTPAAPPPPVGVALGDVGLQQPPPQPQPPVAPAVSAGAGVLLAGGAGLAALAGVGTLSGRRREARRKKKEAEMADAARKEVAGRATVNPLMWQMQGGTADDIRAYFGDSSKYQ